MLRPWGAQRKPGVQAVPVEHKNKLRVHPLLPRRKYRLPTEGESAHSVLPGEEGLGVGGKRPLTSVGVKGWCTLGPSGEPFGADVNLSRTVRKEKHGAVAKLRKKA